MNIKVQIYYNLDHAATIKIFSFQIVQYIVIWLGVENSYFK